MNNTETKQQMQEMVNNIARDIQYGVTYEEAGMDAETYAAESQHYHISGMDYLEDCLDIQYIVTGGCEYLAARVLVAFGGPNIWINTQTMVVEAYWWGDYAVASIDGDSMGLDDSLRELWECR